MLVGQGGTQELQLLDILALHIVQHLPIRDVLTLSYTCKGLRKLVHTGITGATWQHIVARSFPPGTPLQSLPQDQIGAQILRLSALHTSLHSSPASAQLQTFSITRPDRNESLHVQVSPLGSAIVSKEGSSIIYSTLTASRGSGISSTQLWSVPAPSLRHTALVDQLDCAFVWSKAESSIAISFHPHDGDGNAGALISLTRDGDMAWHWLFVLDVPSRCILKVTETPSYRQHRQVMFLEQPAFAPNGTLLLAPWSR